MGTDAFWDQHDAACGQHLLQMAHSQDRALLPAADRGRGEYACRAGTTTAYSFGDDPAMLDDYAWHDGKVISNTKRSARRNPIPGGCTICTATSANGRPTSSSRTFTGRSRIWFPTRSAMANPFTLAPLVAVRGWTSRRNSAAHSALPLHPTGSFRIRNCRRASGTTPMQYLGFRVVCP